MYDSYHLYTNVKRVCVSHRCVCVTAGCCVCVVRPAVRSVPLSDVLSASPSLSHFCSSSDSTPHTPHRTAHTHRSSPDTHNNTHVTNMMITRLHQTKHTRYIHDNHTAASDSKHTHNTVVRRCSWLRRQLSSLCRYCSSFSLTLNSTYTTTTQI